MRRRWSRAAGIVASVLGLWVLFMVMPLQRLAIDDLGSDRPLQVAAHPTAEPTTVRRLPEAPLTIMLLIGGLMLRRRIAEAL